MTDIIKRINDYVQNNENKKSKIDHIKKFIETNYMDYDLNASKIRTFKKYEDTTPGQYRSII